MSAPAAVPPPIDPMNAPHLVHRLLVVASPSSARGPLPKVIPVLNESLRGRGLEIESLPIWGAADDAGGGIARILRVLRAISIVARSLAGRHHDAVLIHTAHDVRALTRDVPLLVAATLASRTTRRLVVLHGSQPRRALLRTSPFGVLSRLLVRLSHRLIVLSSEEEREWAAVGPKVRVSKCRLPLPELAEPGQQQDFEWSKKRPYVLFVGRLIEQKGVYRLLDAVAHLADSRTRLVYVGAGPEYDGLRRKAEMLGLGGQVELPGYLNGGELTAALKSADALVLPTSWIEGFPVVLLEALSTGTPIVTSPIRGAKDWLVDGVHGRLVDPRDVGALAHSIRVILSDRPTAERMARANLALAKSFAPDQVVDDWIDAINTELGSSEG